MQFFVVIMVLNTNYNNPVHSSGISLKCHVIQNSTTHLLQINV